MDEEEIANMIGMLEAIKQDYAKQTKQVELLRKENAELQGYKRVVEDLKKEGFDSYMSISEYVKKCSNRGKFIDWMNEHYPDVVKEYLGFTDKE